jgi:hypothetical protein
MSVTIKFVSGQEKVFVGDTAARNSGFIVVYIWNRKLRKYESADTFPASSVAWAKFGDNVVVGDGQVRSDGSN